MRRRSLSSAKNSSAVVSNSTLSSSKKTNKYQARKTTVDGLSFDSRKEAQRYGDLKLLQMSGEIKDLKVHPSFDLEVNGILVCRYVADFSYFQGKGPKQLVVEDVKGMKKGAAWQMFRVKAKLLKAIRDIEVQVI